MSSASLCKSVENLDEFQKWHNLHVHPLQPFNFRTIRKCLLAPHGEIMMLYRDALFTVYLPAYTLLL